MSTQLASDAKAPSSAPVTETNNKEQNALVPAGPQAAGKPSVQLQVGTQGFSLGTLDEAWRFCTAMAQSGMMPKGIDTAQKVLYALQLGFEVGLPPLAAVQSIAVINGRASLYGDVVLGLVISSGKLDMEVFEEDWVRTAANEITGAYCLVKRLPNGKPKRWDFTIDDAIQAKLWKKEGPWSTMPKRMLQMRARMFALRDVFPDVLKGIISREEAADLPPEKNITPPATRPTTLDGLAETFTSVEEAATAGTEAAAPPLQPIISPDVPEREETEVGRLDSQVPGDTDPLAAVRAELAECKFVVDVNRVKAKYTGPASKLLDIEKSAVVALCDARTAELKAAKTEATKTSKTGVQQGSLPQA